MPTVLYNVPTWVTYIAQTRTVPGFLCSRPNWAPNPLTPKRGLLPLFCDQGGRHTCLRERGRGDPIPTKRQTLWYSVQYVYYNLSTHKSLKGSLYYASIIFFSFVLENEPNILLLSKRIPDLSLCTPIRKETRGGE